MFNSFRLKVTDQYAAAIREATGCTVEVTPSGDYVQSEALSIFVDNSGKCSNDTRANIEVRIYFSLVLDNSYAIYCLPRKGHSNISELPFRVETLPDGVRNFLDTVRESLKSQNLKEITESQYTEMAPGKFTEMDGVPATVFEAYFAELIYSYRHELKER